MKVQRALTPPSIKVMSAQDISLYQPTLTAPAPPGIGKILKFHHHNTLKSFLPDPQKVTVAWLHLKQGEELLARAQSLRTMIFIYKGSADLIGAQSTIVSAGELLLIPSKCRYGFTNVRSEGLSAIEIKFDEHPANLVAESIHAQTGFPLTYDGLMAYNETRLQQILKNPFFTMVKDDTLKDPEIRQKFLDSVQICSNFFQEAMFIRQATCHDKTYQPIFWQHLKEEFGHDELLATRKIKHEATDPILHATSSWFAHQMIVLDNIEKAALIHLTLEVGGFYYHSWAKEKLNDYVESDYYDIHSEADEEHAEMAKKMLQDQTPDTYQRLYQIVDRGWDMVDAMTSRVAYLSTT